MDTLRRLRFTRHRPRSHRRHFITEEDVRILLGRLPPELWARLQAVHLNDRAKGARRAGYVNLGHREISVCALPHRVSIGSRRGRSSPEEFGAVPGCQWPTLAVRRYLLYNTFLHELGHLQLVRPSAREPWRRFAGERLAQRFADQWRRRLWFEPFDHPDPVHHPPAAGEMLELRARWVSGHGAYKQGLRAASRRPRDTEAAAEDYTRAVVIYPRHAAALAGLGELSWAGVGTEQSPARAVRMLSDALHADPGLDDARLHLAIALDYVGRRDEARAAFERAVKLDAYPPVTAVQYARAVAAWGLFDEAATRFARILRRRPNDHYAMTEFARALLIDGRPDAATSAARALRLCESAVTLDRASPAAHYFLALALHRTGGDRQRAIAHLRSALKLRSEYPVAEALLEELQQTHLAQGAPR